LQELLISISTKYINADLSDIDELVKRSLEQIGKFVSADRGYIFFYDFVNNTTSNIYEWCARDIEPEIHNLQNVPVDFIAQWLDAHKNGKVFCVEDVRLLPEDGEFGLRAILEPQGVKSLITIPMTKNNELIGFVGFDSVREINKYSENEKSILFVFANMLVNVIQRKENEIQIKEQEQRQVELLKDLSLQNEELNEYAHVVSHDLKAPLINIHNIVNWFIDDNKEELSENFFNPLKQVLFNVEKMDFLIKGILEYSTIDKLELEDQQINLNLLIDVVLKTILIPVHIKITVQENLPSLYGNSLRFRQVFQNLIQNAIKYSDKEKGVIEIGVIEKDEYFEFFVKDNGIGIKSDYFDKIFKVFTKLESTSSSSGIGLSIVKKIVTYYKGSVWLESKEGLGTTFYFTLPK
jgi:signal transduction histidine kinase